MILVGGANVLLELLKLRSFTKFYNIGAKLSFIPASKSLEDNVLPQYESIYKRILQM
jgi:hypothetical protein